MKFFLGLNILVYYLHYKKELLPNYDGSILRGSLI